MKILAIRGKNLASLAGEFNIPFTEEPLASAGLFAISGPTGSGKSTLLDALCLALYDDTPRLLKAGSKGVRLPDVAGETVTPDDTSTLLRRGAAEGYAEVDFVGNDSCAYRARWSVRRSKAKADGRLQKSVMTLKRLPQLQEIGGTNTEVKAEIVQRIGLSFEQFTRSVLLAQNEFSAFLKVDDNERGELLETLTGIVIYTAISKRAYERAKLEQAALTRLNDRLADQMPLSADERTQLDVNSRLATETLAKLEQHKNTLAGQLRWYESLVKVQQGEAQAQEELDKLQLEQIAAAPRKTEFERIEAVQDARALLADCERIQAEIANIRLAIEKGAADLERATLVLRSADELQAVAQQGLMAAELRQVAAEPDLERAKILDTRLDTLVPLHRQAEQMNEEARAAQSSARQMLDANDAQRASAQKEQQKTADWLAEHAHLETLANNWPRWDTLLGQASTMARDEAGFNAELAAVQQTQHANVLYAANAELALIDEAVSLAKSRRLSCQAQLAQFDAMARLTRKLAAEARRDELGVAEQLWQDLAGKQSEQWRLNSEAGQLQDSLRQAEAALDQLSEQVPAANAALIQAERSLKSAEAACAENVETLRAALEEGEACPVCGALDHPFSRDNPQLHAMLDSLIVEVARCREDVVQLQKLQTTHQTQAVSRREQLEVVTELLLKLKEGIRISRSAWESHALAGELGDIGTEEYTAWFTGQQLRVREQLQATGAEESAERDALTARDQAQTECDRVLEQHTRSKDAVTAALAGLAKARAECAAVAAKQADAAQRLEGTISELDSAFDNQGWVEAWRSAPETFHAKCKSETGLWNRQCKARDDRAVELGKLDVAHVALLDALTLASAETVRAASAFAISAADIEAIQTERSALFGGQDTRLIQTGLSDAIARAKNQLASQLERMQQCTDAKTRCEAALDQAGNQLVKLTRNAQNADAAMEQWLVRFNLASPLSISLPQAGESTNESLSDFHVIRSDATLNLEQLRALLDFSQDWINSERKQLQLIESSIQNLKTVLQERHAQRDLIEKNRPTNDSAEVIRDALILLDSELQTAHAAAATLQLSIAQDKARREQSASMLNQIEAAAATYRIWAQLSELIGSADGKKFRNYAQQFTLDVLLGYANRHLEELSRRYRLERIADTLALMVVDQDMGDEQRSVHSLSGGESFLVSLALALGLASLSSNRVRVESLFIDEGFGSLDPETLSVAMDALDGLQAMGRKVGVISHVQEMTERISTKILVQRQAGGKSLVVIV